VTKRSLSPIENDHIILRLLERDDLPLTLAWRNQEHIRKWFLNTGVILEENHIAWFEHYEQLDHDFVFVILAKEFGNTPIGQVSLYNIDWNAKVAEFGRLLIGEPFAKGKGYAKEATRLLVEFGFHTLGLQEITLEVKEANKTAIAIYHTIGFIETSRKNDLLVMSIQA
jgi:RimJ/RimL family protein N-acetyltransferase